MQWHAVYVQNLSGKNEINKIYFYVFFFAAVNSVLLQWYLELTPLAGVSGRAANSIDWMWVGWEGTEL